MGLVSKVFARPSSSPAWALAGLVLCSLTVDGRAGAQPQPVAVRRIAPPVWAWLELPAYRRYRCRGAGKRPADTCRANRVPVSVRMAAGFAPHDLSNHEDDELVLHRLPSGRLAAVGQVVAATATRAGLERLAKLPGVSRVELDVRPPIPPPLDYTVADIDVDDAWLARGPADLPLSGAGVVIADIDSGIDPLHPHFFRATGVYRDWLDADGNGRFDPGIDGIDLDGDKMVSTGETVRFFDAVAVDLGTYDPILGTSDGALDLDWDHLYLDANGNGRRDTGVADGFAESDPTYGEQLLYADDVDRSGTLDPGERLVALAESKIRATYDGSIERKRGVDLIATSFTEWALHGTGVAGILAGGNRGFTRLVGIAPDAELLMADYWQGGSVVALLAWAIDGGADVVLHEFAPWASTHLDGSTNYEAAMDAAAAQGVVQVNPAGNLGGSQKHAIFTVPPVDGRVIGIEVPAWLGAGFVQLTLHWRQPTHSLSFRLATPIGDVDLGTAGTSGIILDDDTSIYASRDDSSRGTAMFDMWIYREGRNELLPLAAGTWQLVISEPSASPDGAPIEVAAYVSDDMSAWGQGVRFLDGVSEKHLVCMPSTADSAIGVAAYTGHDEPPYAWPGDHDQHGALRRYSNRGTRLDGANVIDLAAPDNPVSATTRMDLGYGNRVGLGAFAVFGGTSGAGPHVAGVAALAKQLYPEHGAAQVEAALRTGALVDEQVTGDGSHTVEQLWGAGKLRAYRTLFGEEPAAGTPPSLTATPVEAKVGRPVALLPRVTDAEDEPADLVLTWDDDYDGTWDVGPTPGLAAREVTFATIGTRWLKVMVRDSSGRTAAALQRIDVSAADEVDPSWTDAGCACRAGAPGRPSGPVLLIVGTALAILQRVARSRRQGT